MADLKSCPFCGGEAEAVHEINGFWTVECVKCGALVDGIEAWNTRYPADLDAVPMTEENMKRHGWVRERTCKMEYSGGVPDFISLDTWFCTECGSPIYNDCEPSYCEYCGAKVVE